MRYLIIFLLILNSCVDNDLLFNSYDNTTIKEKEYTIEFSSIDIHLIILNSLWHTYNETLCSLNVDFSYIMNDTSFIQNILIEKIFVENKDSNLIFGIEYSCFFPVLRRKIIYFNYDSIYHDEKDCVKVKVRIIKHERIELKWVQYDIKKYEN